MYLKAWKIKCKNYEGDRFNKINKYTEFQVGKH
jgi:hypothetical protein